MTGTGRDNTGTCPAMCRDRRDTRLRTCPGVPLAASLAESEAARMSLAAENVELRTRLAAFEANQDAVLIAALGELLDGSWASSREIWELVRAEADAAFATGNTAPEAWAALQKAGVHNTHALGRLLARLVDAGHIEREPSRGVCIWRIGP
jgi:hypothetical protein